MKTKIITITLIIISSFLFMGSIKAQTTAPTVEPPSPTLSPVTDPLPPPPPSGSTLSARVIVRKMYPDGTTAGIANARVRFWTVYQSPGPDMQEQSPIITDGNGEKFRYLISCSGGKTHMILDPTSVNVPSGGYWSTELEHYSSNIYANFMILGADPKECNVNEAPNPFGGCMNNCDCRPCIPACSHLNPLPPTKLTDQQNLRGAAAAMNNNIASNFTLRYTYHLPVPTATPIPLPTKIPCGQPCTDNPECEIDCPICAPGPNPAQKICVAPTATPTVPGPPPPTGTPTPIPLSQCIQCTDSTNCAYGLQCLYCDAIGNKLCVQSSCSECISPTPTSTPVPTNTPIPSPTPTASCNCLSLNYTGEINKGKTIVVTTKAKVENPAVNRAKVLNMVYHLEINGVETAVSQPIVPAAPYLENGADIYTTTWTYTIPQTGSGVVYYRIWAKINCGYKTAGIFDHPVFIMGVSAQNKSIFGKILDAIGGLFNPASNVQPLSVAPTAAPTAQPSPTPEVLEDLLSGGVETLKLGTGGPLIKLQKGCTQLLFWLDYDMPDPFQTP